MITLGEAARLTGLGKTTVARAIKAGRLSATRTVTGSYEIDPAELARCYPVTTATEATDATVAATGPVETQIAGLREIGDLLRRQLDEVREDRERWRSQAEAVQRLITGPEERNRRPQTEAARDHRPWWRQLAGPEGLKLIILLGCILLMLGIIADKLK